MASTRERRGETRRSQMVRFGFLYAQQQSIVTTDNLSRSGAFLRSVLSFPSGTLLVLEAVEPPFKDRIRILTKVIHSRRGFPVKGRNAGMGVRWVRVYGDEENLSGFLKEVLQMKEVSADALETTASGDAILDFPEPPRRSTSPEDGVKNDPGSKKLHAAERGRYDVKAPVVFSVDNMHYRGQVRSLGQDGLSVVTDGAVPAAFSRVTIRYPIASGRHSERVLLFGEVDLTVEGQQSCFNVRLTGLDEMDSPGIFRSHLQELQRVGKKL